MSDESPAVAPAAIAAPALGDLAASIVADKPASLFGMQVSHWLGAGVALGGTGALGYLTGEIQPVVHWAVAGGAPDASAEKSIATLAALAVLAVAALVTNYTRRRAVPAAPQNGDTHA
jgi:hypothetical protein